MWPYHPELLERPVPRYTSYPTAAEFAGGVGADDFARALAGASGEVSVYVHIPFCEKICWYCGCNTSAANRRERLVSYLDALHAEIALVGAMLPAGARVSRLAFGGGSPNAITPLDFLRLFDQLTLKLPLGDPLISIEFDPRALAAPWGQVVAGIGATHASLGVQTIAAHLQQAIGRVQPLAMIEAGIDLLRSAGITSLNLDFMYGLPGQSEADLAESLAFAAAHDADRLAVFGYAHVPQLIARQRRIVADDLPGQRQRFAMAWQAHRQLVGAGYAPVGFDHFARPGDPLAQAALNGRLRRNFQGYTEDQAQVLIGLGASAISAFPELLVQNEKNAGRYRMLLSQHRHPAVQGICRSAEDRLRGAVIAGLLCQGRASVPGPLLAALAPRLQPFVEAGLCDVRAGEVAIAAAGLPYSRVIAAVFDAYRQDSPRRFSSAV